jgi:hypothetical protein
MKHMYVDEQTLHVSGHAGKVYRLSDLGLQYLLGVLALRYRQYVPNAFCYIPPFPQMAD